MVEFKREAQQMLNRPEYQPKTVELEDGTSVTFDRRLTALETFEVAHGRNVISAVFIKNKQESGSDWTVIYGGDKKDVIGHEPMFDQANLVFYQDKLPDPKYGGIFYIEEDHVDYDRASDSYGGIPEDSEILQAFKNFLLEEYPDAQEPAW